ncbi:hypothetical protein HPB50_026275 [Hyalomma asiaticum]|uniref:Uncharacterized protein n=1 Tax=Hyalomma asiaticum TaxID=266040 RepID=A0ACB7T4U9_HYAAI|nr:hypothetical protein HPB50_026275 [Hyalomma asiaticum]
MAAFDFIADYSLFEDEEIHTRQDWEVSEFEALDYELFGFRKPDFEQPTSETTIINVDYNLNSPLTTDLVDHSLVNDFGLDPNDLIIGLKPKEREVKNEGRFFALMSWKLREYFVITEYLIKKYYLPLFGALTIADDYVTVVKKLLSSSSGQGLSDYSRVNYSNHLDYSAWNNHQRKEATDPVFRVMGQFFGLPNLFTRTHEFFQNSWIYFPDRADQILLRDDGTPYSPNNQYFWNGQAGGLEGLRQKGWTLLNLLMILRESKIRNTKVTVLAQGDNQVINTSYPIPGNKPLLPEILVRVQERLLFRYSRLLDLLVRELEDHSATVLEEILR